MLPQSNELKQMKVEQELATALMTHVLLINKEE